MPWRAGGLRPVYLPVAGTVDMQDTARQAVEDMAQRMVSIIVISGIDVSGVNHDGWYDTLTTARQAGIPVALLNPIATPTDSTLFAATLTINDRMTDGDAALGPGGQFCPQRASGEQHGTAHQRQQHQQRRQQCGPEGPPAFFFHLVPP